MRRRAPKVNGIRIAKAERIGNKYTMFPAEPRMYWNESRRDWARDDGTHYKSIAAAREAMKRSKLIHRAVIVT